MAAIRTLAALSPLV